MSVTMTLRLDEETSSRLTGLSNATDRSKAYLATQAPKLFLDNNEWQVQEIIKPVAEADAAKPDLFVDNESVMAWMEAWGADHETSSPK